MQMIMNYKTFIGFVVFSVAMLDTISQNFLSAQQARVDLNPDEIVIGQHAALTIEIEAPAEGIIVFPAISDTITKNIEVVRFGLPDTIHKGNGLISLRQKHTVTAWEKGYFPIPPLRFMHIDHPDTIMFETRAQLLQVLGVDVDMEDLYKDIRPIIGMPVTWREVIPWIILLIVAALIIFFTVRWLKNRKPKEEAPTIWEKPDVPAHIAAISSLETLRRKNLWQSGKVKQYYIELSDILRMYLHKRYKINAMEMTTGEIMYVLPEYIDKQFLRERLQDNLQLADLVKFAKHRPETEVHSRVMDESISFVKDTIPTNENNR